MANEYPEHEKLKALGGANQAVGDFIGWLGEHNMLIAEYRRHEIVPVLRSRDDLLAEHFGIDRHKLDQEKRQMIDVLRKAGESK